jgi:phosphate starvation-inducible PhoH-like protein
VSHNHFSQEITLLPADIDRLSNFCGQLDVNLRHIEQRLQVEIANRSNHFRISGDENAVRTACAVMQKLYQLAEREEISPEQVHLSLQDSSIDQLLENPAPKHQALVAIKTKRGVIKGRGQNQQDYLQKILQHDINFGVGPAGTGKTFLAVACAVEAVDPYLRPLYDALYDMLGFERVEKLLEKNVIEVAPLAFMRGRTLNDSFIILDEAQNTTIEQIKMFLTRIGFGSTAVITGDVTQIDLPNEKMSGLKHVLQVLKDVEGISFTFFGVRDVVRHPLVQRIVAAYDKYELQQKHELS